MEENNKKKIISALTKNTLINIAKKNFTEYGFAHTSLEMIVKEANMTRGAIYHHFKNKKDLFLAVLEQIQIDTGKYIEEKASLSNDLWEQLILGCIAFIEFATLSENSRILLIDAPIIIGWTEWKKSDENNSEFYLKEHLSLLKQEGILIDIDINLVTHIISGALNELSLYITKTSPINHEELYITIVNLLKGFKVENI